jgi:hypothetical protein
MREPAGEDLAIVIGPGKGGRKPPGRGMMHSEPDADERGGPPDGDADEMLPPGFEAAASEAFPDMDPASYPALKRLIATCMDSGPEGGY